MVRPLSNDLRERAVKAVGAGEICHAVAARFDVAVSSVVKWRQRYRETGSVAPGKMGGHSKPVLEQHRAFIVARARQTPHLTLHGLKDELAVQGVKNSHHAVWTFLRREGLSSKKTLFALEQGRADVARRRQRWRSLQDRLDTNRLVFIDETWIKANLAPLRGWGFKGERLRGFAPHGHCRTLTFLGALRSDQLTAPPAQGAFGYEKLGSQWSGGGRIGVLVTPQLLTYFSAGYTEAHYNSVNLLNNFAPIGAAQGTYFGGRTYKGYFLGAGDEYTLGFMPGLFWKTEYRFSDLDTRTNDIRTIATNALAGDL